MNDQLISEIVTELAPQLVGRFAGKVFQLARTALAIDFRTLDGRYLFLSVEPVAPRLYMIERRVRDLEKASLPPSPFALALRKHLGQATLRVLTKDAHDRVVRFSFATQDEIGNQFSRTLIAQLTGRAANLLLLDERDLIIDALRPPRGSGQEIGARYQPPPVSASVAVPRAANFFGRGSFKTLSEAADAYYTRVEAERAFTARVAAARAKLQREISARVKLRRHLADDLAMHGDAEEHKRIGDLLLANLATHERRGNKIILTDYYTENAPPIELEVDANSSLQEEAARRFARYTKAKRAAQEIARRLENLENELKNLHAKQLELEYIINAHDEAALETFDGQKKSSPPSVVKKQKGNKAANHITGVRRYVSSDGYEILVGRAARDNDSLTFRVARPHDLWLHAADYPGSHVVVRNPARTKEIPQRTIIEAAQLAAHFSDARRAGRVDVHYTSRKFLAKPKNSAPGLVRLASFRTLTVEPRESLTRIA
jgi:predicted ribosome quality control (RQC) complex YloA/Tae2 family protein